MTDDTHLAILSLLAEGHDIPAILHQHPTLTRDDIQAAAALALTTLESGPRVETAASGASEDHDAHTCPHVIVRVETRAERIQRLQQTHARAYAPWTDEEDARLVQRWDEGARISELARELGRQPGALRQRLERHLGPKWRDRPRA